MARILVVLVICGGAFLGMGCPEKRAERPGVVAAGDRPAAHATAPAQPPAPVTPPAPPPPPDPARGEPVAWVVDHYIYVDDVKGKRLGGLVGGPLGEEFARQNHIEPTEEQLARCERLLRSWPEREDAQIEAERREMARGMVTGWLIDKALYERHGGVVIFQQANPSEPVGAYRAFFEEQERLGRFKIFDAGQREEFWAYYTREHPFQVPKDEVDFSRPWWEKPVPADRR